MPDPSGYELTPPEPKKEPAPPSGPLSAAPIGTPAMPTPVPPGFVPPVPIVEGPDPDPDAEAAKDAEENRATACLAYVIFLLPLVFAPKSKFARYHANQGLLLACCGGVWLIIIIALGIAREITNSSYLQNSLVGNIFGWILSCGCIPLFILLGLGLVVLAFQGIINAANSEMKPLPVIGKITLLKPLP